MDKEVPHKMRCLKLNIDSLMDDDMELWSLISTVALNIHGLLIINTLT